MSEADKIVESLKNSGRKVEKFYTGNKGSDKNVGSIEEDIRILQEKDCMWHYPETRIEEAIEDIIADYTRQKQINEEHKKINGELREKVKELEEERQLVGIPVRNKRDGAIGIVLHQWKSGSIAVLENINPRVINTHDSWSTLEIITDEIKQTKTKDDSIAKQKIKDSQFDLLKRIKELEKENADLKKYNKTVSDRIVEYKKNSIPMQVVIDKMEELNKEIKSCDEIDAIFKIKQQQILQELLEGERK